MLEQVAGGAAQDQESSGVPWSVRKNAQQREQIRSALNLVDDHKTAERFECEPWALEPAEVQRIFEIEVVAGWVEAGFLGGYLAGDGCLARLAWAEEGDAGEASKELLDALEEVTALHAETVHEKSVSGTEFS